MALIKTRKSPYWFMKFEIAGKSFTRSTKETSKRKAQLIGDEIKRQVLSLYERPGAVSTISEARVAEVARVEADTGSYNASRVEYALWNFEAWLLKRSPKLPVVHQITTELIEDYQRARLVTAAKDTVDREIHAISRMLRRSGHLVDKPKAKPGKRTEVRAFTNAELEGFFANAPEPFATACLLMLYTGSRPAEIFVSSKSRHVAVLKEELDLTTGAIRIRSAKRMVGQSIHFRQFKLPCEVVERLKSVAASHDFETIFPPIILISRHFDRTIQMAGIKKMNVLGQKLTTHSFRHTFATKLAESVGHSPFAIKAALGHSTLNMTDRYVHPTTPVIEMDFGSFSDKPGDYPGDSAAEAKIEIV